MINALQTILSLLINGKQISESFLNQAIDFSNNFTNICLHGKEEKFLFPTLENKGVPRGVGRYSKMLYETSNNKKKFLSQNFT